MKQIIIINGYKPAVLIRKFKRGKQEMIEVEWTNYKGYKGSQVISTFNKRKIKYRVIKKRFSFKKWIKSIYDTKRN